MMNIHPEEIHRAAELLAQHKLVAFPTETVYGLGGNALSDVAVSAIYAAKNRPTFNPLIVHVHSYEEAKAFVTFSDHADHLARRFWPGPLTLVLPRRKDCPLSLLLSAGLDTVAVRVPAHPVAQALLAQSKFPIAAPSANQSGRISPTEAQHVQDELKDKVAMILDGGPCSVGIESTVVDMTQDVPVLLRPGSVTEAQLEDALGFLVRTNHDGTIKAPGMLASHYAPDKALRLNATSVNAGEGLLAFGKPLTNVSVVENLSESGNLQEAAANLFRMLRKLDASSANGIAVMSIPNEGLGVAINDRLTRAAAPKN